MILRHSYAVTGYQRAAFKDRGVPYAAHAHIDTQTGRSVSSYIDATRRVKILHGVAPCRVHASQTNGFRIEAPP